MRKRGAQQVSVTDLVTKKHITMEKWKKNKRNLSEERITCLILAEFDPTQTQKTKTTGSVTQASVKTLCYRSISITRDYIL